MKSPSHISDPELARLLSGRDELSVLERERLRDQILDASCPKVHRWWHLSAKVVTAGVLSTAAAAALGLLVLRGAVMPLSAGDTPREHGVESQVTAAPKSDESFVARGGTAGPSLEISCVRSGGLGRCNLGSKLTFKVAARGQWQHFSAFSQTSDGTIFWYFPGPSGVGVALDAGAEPRLLDSAAVLTDEMVGSLTIYGVFSSEPFTRDDVKRALGPQFEADASIRLVKRRVVVEARE